MNSEIEKSENWDASTEEEGRNEELYHRMQRFLRRHMFGEKEGQDEDSIKEKLSFW